MTSEEGNTGNSGDFMDLWKQWYTASARAWSGILEGSKGAPADSHDLYQLWLKGLDSALEQMQGGSASLADTAEAWKRWLETSEETWRRVIEVGGDPLGLTLQWLRMMESMRARVQAGEAIPSDPFTLFKQWYDATSETWARNVGDFMESEQFMQAVTRFLENYTSFAKLARRNSEEYFGQLQLPTRADIARIAGLVVALEEKVDQIQDEFEDRAGAPAADTAGPKLAALNERLAEMENRWESMLPTIQKLASLERLEQRLGLIEGKLDGILNALAKVESGQPPVSAAATTSTSASKRSPRTVRTAAAKNEKAAKNTRPRSE